MALNLDKAQTVGESIEIGVGGPGITKHNATPEGAVTAPVGSIVLRTDTGQVYKKTSGSGNTGWVDVSSGGGGSAWLDDDGTTPSPLPSATGSKSVAIGQGAVATTSDSFAIGTSSEIKGTSPNSIAIGKNSKVGRLPPGYDNSASDSIAIGNGAKVFSGDYYSNTSITSGIAIGKNSYSTGDYSISIGHGGTAGQNTIAIGKSSSANASDCIVIGRSSGSNASYGIAIGKQAITQTNSAIAIGRNASAITYANTIALGRSSTSSGDATISIGYNASASNLQSIAIGKNSSAVTSNALAIGKSASAGAASVAIGYTSNASGSNSVAIGRYAASAGVDSVGIGRSATSSGFYSIAIGKSTVANSYHSIAIGTFNSGSGAKAVSAIAIGQYGHARIINSIQVQASSIIRKDEAAVIQTTTAAFKWCAGNEAIVFTKEVAIDSGTPSVTLTVPSNSTFYPNEVGVIYTSGTLTTPPTVSFGITGNTTKFVSATATSVANLYDRDVFSVSSTAGESSLVAAVTSAGTGTSSKARFYFKGLLLENQ